MPHRNALNLDSNHNTAIRAEIGERLQVLLSKEQPNPAPRVQHLLDCLSTLDATIGRTHEQHDVYRRQATEAENQAWQARNEIDRAVWLRVALGWLSLLRKSERR